MKEKLKWQKIACLISTRYLKEIKYSSWKTKLSDEKIKSKKGNKYTA